MLHKCLSAFCPPLFSVPLVISPLAFLPFLRSSCGYLFCPFSSGVFSFSTSSFGGFGLLHSPAYSSPSACSLGVPGTSVLPSSGVSMGWGVCIRGVLHRYCLRLSCRCFFSLRCLATSVCASSCGSFFLSSCFPASGCLRVLSLTLLSCLRLPCRGLSLLLLAGALLRWFQCFLVTCGALPGAPLLSAASVALLLLAPLRVSKVLPLRCLGLLGLFVSMRFAPGRSRVFSGLFSYSFLRCSSCLRCRSLWLCLSAVQALLGFLFPCSLLLGFSAASSLPPFCAAPVASAAGLSAFPQLRLATSLFSLALLLCLAVLRLMLRCLGLL